MPSRVGGRGPARSCLSAPQHAPCSLSAGEIFATTKRAYESLSRDREAVRGRTKWFPVTGGGGRPRAGHMRADRQRPQLLFGCRGLATVPRSRRECSPSPLLVAAARPVWGRSVRRCAGGRYVSCGSTGACDPVRRAVSPLQYMYMHRSGRAVLYPAVARVPACRRHGACTGKGAPRRPVRPERPATHVTRVIMPTAHVRPGSGRALPLHRSRSRLSGLARAANKPPGGVGMGMATRPSAGGTAPEVGRGMLRGRGVVGGAEKVERAPKVPNADRDDRGEPPTGVA